MCMCSLEWSYPTDAPSDEKKKKECAFAGDAACLDLSCFCDCTFPVFPTKKERAASIVQRMTVVAQTLVES